MSYAVDLSVRYNRLHKMEHRSLLENYDSEGKYSLIYGSFFFN